MADNVVLLRPRSDQAAPDAYADFNTQRLALISAWTRFLRGRPDAGDVLQEIHATATAMRSLADLMVVQHGGGSEG